MNNRKINVIPSHIVQIDPKTIDTVIRSKIELFGINEDPSIHDSLEDLCREALSKDGGLDTFLEERCAERASALAGEALVKLLSSIMHARRPKLAAWQIAFAAGLDLTENKTGPQCAAMSGMTKQAWFQGVDKIRKQLGINYLTPHTRDNQARAEMSKAYKRKGKA